MAYNPPGHFKIPMPTTMIKLQSSDGEVLEVEVKVAQLSLLIKEMLDDLGVEETEVISMPQNAPEISGAILRKIIHWANHHKDDPAVADEDEKEEKTTDDISSWDAQFLKVDQSTLFTIISAANYLNIKSLLDVTCKKVAQTIKGMTLEEVRQKFNIQNDFSPHEEEQLRKENAWCEGIDSEKIIFRSEGGSVLDKISSVSIQDVDNEGGPVVEDCLKNSVVVRKIFQHISNPELLKLSTMSKNWSYEARLLMRKRGNVIARLVCHNTRPCHQVFKAFGADLQEMNVVPYSGMNIVISPKSHPIETEALDPTYQVIVARLTLKHFSLRLAGKWWDCKHCPAFQLLKKLMEDFSGVLEELTLDIEEKRDEFIEHFVRDCTFSGMKVLKLQEEHYTFGDSYTNYMKALVDRAPNLHDLHTYGRINLKKNLMEGSSGVLIPQQEVCAPFDAVSESLIHKLRLTHVQLFYTGPEFNLDGFNRIAPILLQASCAKTLRVMGMDGVLAVPLMCYGISLENVNNFGMALNYDDFELAQPHLLRIVKDFDFTRIFPNSEAVGIYSSSEYFEPLPDHINEIIEQANAVLREPLPDRAANIKELSLHQSSISASAIQFFAEMFPDIQKLEIETDEEEHVPFGSIWKHWSDLKEIIVTGQMIPNTGNLDSVFCGIFPEEVAELRQKDDDYLKSVHIVPVMPAITCLKNLKTLSLDVEKRSNEPYVDDGTFIFSKVTGFIAFAKCPSLAISLDMITYGIPPVSHLEPFASVVCTDLSVDPMEGYEPIDMTGFIQQLQLDMGVDFDAD